MKETFISKKFTEESFAVIGMAQEICTSYQRQGYDLSLRQLYYQFISRDYFPNTEASYKRLGSIINDARLAGMIDWDNIKDRGREMTINPHWDDPSDFMRQVMPQFKIDTWIGQPNYVELMVEKQALEGVLEPICRRLDIAFTANKGYSSASNLYEAGKRLRGYFLGDGDHCDYDFNQLWVNSDHSEQGYFNEDASCHYAPDRAHEFYENDNYDALDRLLANAYREFMLPHPKGGRAVHVIYLGDHDPSGIDMTRDVKERLELFSGVPVNVHRIALNMPQVRQYNPPENPAKTTDSRSSGYIKQFGSSSWELDALNPEVLAGLVNNTVIALRDDETYNTAVERQKSWRERLVKMSDEFID